MKPAKKILVTAETGFIGSHACVALIGPSLNKSIMAFYRLHKKHAQ